MLDTAEKQAIVNQWILFGNSTLGDGLFSPQNNTKETPRLLGKLDSIFASQSYLTGDRLTAADIAVGTVLSAANQYFWFHYIKLIRHHNR